MEQENMPALTLTVFFLIKKIYYFLLSCFAGDTSIWPFVWSWESAVWWEVSNTEGQWVKKMSHLFAFSILELGNCCESDLHLLPFKYTELFQSLNANSSVKSPSFQSMPPWLHPYFISCQLFTSVFGVGPKTAEKWYRLGLRSFSDVLADHSIQLNRMQQYGTSISRFSSSATPEIIDWTL